MFEDTITQFGRNALSLRPKSILIVVGLGEPHLVDSEVRTKRRYIEFFEIPLFVAHVLNDQCYLIQAHVQPFI